GGVSFGAVAQEPVEPDTGGTGSLCKVADGRATAACAAIYEPQGRAVGICPVANDPPPLQPLDISPRPGDEHAPPAGCRGPGHGLPRLVGRREVGSHSA